MSCNQDTFTLYSEETMDKQHNTFGGDAVNVFPRPNVPHTLVRNGIFLLAIGLTNSIWCIENVNSIHMP